MRGTAARVVGVALAALFVVGGGVSWAQDKPAPEKATPAADVVAGDWEGTVETPGGTVGFTLQIKLDGEKVSGQISSSEGGGPISGSWAGGKLSITFDYNGTTMEMTGALKDGALSGELIHGGEAAMPWTAKRAA